MTSPEKKKEEEEVSDLQLSFAFGNTFVKPQTPHITPEDAEPQELPDYSAEELCLSRTNLKHITDSILKHSKLKRLYLERNQITHIPGSLFISLPNLVWLDLRNNQIETLPAEIGSHRCLKILLLEGNPLSELPAELGNVITLRGLNLRDCPITFPPRDIVNQGVEGILQYLRSISVRKTPPVVEPPLVEKLQLSELTGSSAEEQEESVDEEEEELQRFRELKRKTILLDKAELGPIGQEDRKSHPPPVIKSSQEALRVWRSKAKQDNPKKLIKPRNQEFQEADTDSKPGVEDRGGSLQVQTSHMTIIEREESSRQKALRVWRSKAKQDKPKKLIKSRNQEFQEADTDSKPGVEDRGGSLQVQTSRMTIIERKESRSATELERQICANVKTLQERRRNPSCSSSEQMVAAEQDMEEMRKLQTRLLERRTNRDRNLDKGFIIFTADT